MRVSVLGPVEISNGGLPVRLSGRGQRTVLSALAAQHGTVVPVSRLIEALWGAAPPPTARTKIQSHVSGLRLALGSDVRDASGPLHTIRPGYMLSADRSALDATEFADLLARSRQAGQPAVVSALLRDALALWRGPAFTCIASPVIRTAARNLDRQRLLAVEAKADADLSLGHYDTVASELSGWLDAHPLRERLRGLLMRALHQGGCRADALGVYRAGQQVMLHELGLEPSSQLQSLYREIIADAVPSSAGRDG
jgi:DNA-binding SARP family transcriptional activator